MGKLGPGEGVGHWKPPEFEIEWDRRKIIAVGARCLISVRPFLNKKIEKRERFKKGFLSAVFL
jgi:hypothetical protein